MLREKKRCQKLAKRIADERERKNFCFIFIGCSLKCFADLVHQPFQKMCVVTAAAMIIVLFENSPEKYKE